MGGALPRRRSFNHSAAKIAAAARATASTNGVRPIPLGDVLEWGGTANPNVRVADCPRASVTVTETAYVPFEGYVWVGFAAVLCPPSPKSH